MPTVLHDLLVEMLTRRPELLLELAMDVGIELPVVDEVTPLPADLSTLVSTELRADLVLQLRTADGVVRMAVVVEIQLGRDADKLYSWPLYVASLRHRLRCPVALVVFATDAGVARWAMRGCELMPGHRFAPLVIGPERVPAITDLDWARRDPERSVLSALTHVGDLDVARAAIWAIKQLDDERLLVCVDTIMHIAGPEAAQRLTEMEMPIQNYEWKSDFAKKYVGEGKAEGKAESLLTFLRARGFVVDELLERRIRAQTDFAALDAWIEAAAVATSLDDVFVTQRGRVGE